MTKGKTFIISGPSGVGKSTVLNALLKEYPDLYFSVSATTRGPREGEVDGVHYHFIAPEFFHQMIEEDAFLEYAEYVGNFYGTPKKFVDAAIMYCGVKGPPKLMRENMFMVNKIIGQP